MKRVWSVLIATVSSAALVPAVASAATSPSLTTGAATAISTTSVTLEAVVTPNGAGTVASFSYGTTNALGVTTTARHVGAGLKAVAFSQVIGGLTPGTVYYYRVNALNAEGGVTGAIRSFRTAGPAPPGAVTGPAVGVGRTRATVTGSITTNGAPTTWVVQYGLTDLYGLQTMVVSPLAASPVATPVTYALTGLAPATLFHYRVVAYHNGVFAGAGSDATFFTEPDRPPTPRMSTKTTPSRAARSPYRFTTAGTLSGAGFIPAAQRCAGNVGVRYRNGRRQLAYVVAPVTPSCTFSAAVSIRSTRGTGAVPLTVSIDFRGTGYLAPVSRVDHVTAGS